MVSYAPIEEAHPVDRHVGKRVVELRLSRGYNQSELGRALGLSFQQVQKYEKGSNRISSSKLWDISRFLGVDVSYFFEGLTDSQQGFAEDGGSTFAHSSPATRYSVEITKLAPRLSVRQQKLALELMETMLEPAPQ